MRTFYYYMPPCPKCGSEVTGRYILQPLINKKHIMLESLKNGEIVRFAKQIPKNNAFCCDCGFEWHEQPRLVRIEEEEKDGEKARRGTDRLLHEYMVENHINPDKKPILGGIFSGFTNFF